MLFHQLCGQGRHQNWNRGVSNIANNASCKLAVCILLAHPVLIGQILEQFETDGDHFVRRAPRLYDLDLSI